MDDIDYLKAHSQRNSYMFYIDSAKRNRNVYPHPNYYQVQFNTPLRNVYSIQVLDASIPRTHYNVDSHNNRMYYRVLDTEYYVDLDIGDYTSQQLVSSLNEKLNNNSIFVEFLSSPPEKRKQFLFKSRYPFVICTFKSTIRKTLGFDEGDYLTIDAKDDPSYYDKHVVKDTLADDTTLIDISQNYILWQKFVPNNTGRINTVRFNVQTTETSMGLKVYVYNAQLDTLIAESSVLDIIPSTSVALFDTWTTNNAELNEGETYYLKIAPTGQHAFAVYVTPQQEQQQDDLYIYYNNIDTPFVPHTCSEHLASL